MTPTVSVAYDSVRIFFGDVLHLHLKRSDLLAVQSWRTDEKNFSVEYVMRGNTVTTEYDSREKWESSILKQLEGVLP